MESLLALASGVLYMAGIYLMLRRRLAELAITHRATGERSQAIGTPIRSGAGAVPTLNERRATACTIRARAARPEAIDAPAQSNCLES